MNNQIRFQCTKCKTVMNAPGNAAGRKVKCIKCGQGLQIPPAEDAKEALTPTLTDPENAMAGMPASDFTVWYYTCNGTKLGPVYEEELQQLLATGKVSAREQVWKEGMSDWAPACNVMELLATTSLAMPSGPEDTPQRPMLGHDGTATPAGGSGFAVTGMVLGIVAFGLAFIPCFGWVFGILLGLLGAIFSCVGLGQRAKGMAVAGLMLSFLAIIWAPLWFFLIVSWVTSVSNSKAERKESKREDRSIGNRDDHKILDKVKPPVKDEGNQRDLKRQAEIKRIQEDEKEKQRLEEERKEAKKREAEEKDRKEKERLEDDAEKKRKADLEGRGLAYYPKPKTLYQGKNADDWSRYARAYPFNAMIQNNTYLAYISLGKEGVPFLLAVLETAQDPNIRHLMIIAINPELIHFNDLSKLVSYLDKKKCRIPTRMVVLRYLGKRKESKAHFQRIQTQVQDLLKSKTYRIEAKEILASIKPTDKQ